MQTRPGKKQLRQPCFLESYGQAEIVPRARREDGDITMRFDIIRNLCNSPNLLHIFAELYDGLQKPSSSVCAVCLVSLLIV